MQIRKIVVTTGEPAGIGPDIVLSAALKNWPCKLIAIGNNALLEARAQQLKLNISLKKYSSVDEENPPRAGTLALIDLPLNRLPEPGLPNPQNAGYVLAQLDLAVELCRSGEVSAMVTSPVQKAIINEGGVPFSGHTEFLGTACEANNPLMLLVAGDLRIALATTHLPLRRVPDAVTAQHLSQQISTLYSGLSTQFGLANPKIIVLGLNPHAGENGHLGDEETNIIGPVCESLRNQNISIDGPISADTAFVPRIRRRADAYMAMYHDQALPVLKSTAFHTAVNVTLGLPIIRTSVDHGTALDLAGSGLAKVSSMEEAISMALRLTQKRGG